MPILTLDREIKLYVLLCSVFCAVALLSNLVIKLVSLPFIHLAIPFGLLMYPFTFLIADLVAEIYGSEKALFMIYVGFGLGIFAHLLVQWALRIPPHPAWTSTFHEMENAETYQKAFAAVFGFNGIATFASLAAFAVSQTLDIFLFAKLKALTQGKFLWLRNNAATLASQLIDTLIVDTLLLRLGLQLEWSFVLTMMATSYAYKALFSLVNTPLFYLGVNVAKRYLGMKSPLFEKISTKSHFPLNF